MKIILILIIINFNFTFRRNTNRLHRRRHFRKLGLLRNVGKFFFGGNRRHRMYKRIFTNNKINSIENDYYVKYLEKLKHLITRRNKDIFNNFRLINKYINNLYTKSIIILN